MYPSFLMDRVVPQTVPTESLSLVSGYTTAICDSRCHRQTTGPNANAQFYVLVRIVNSQSQVSVTRIDATTGWTFDLTTGRRSVHTIRRPGMVFERPRVVADVYIGPGNENTITIGWYTAHVRSVRPKNLSSANLDMFVGYPVGTVAVCDETIHGDRRNDGQTNIFHIKMLANERFAAPYVNALRKQRHSGSAGGLSSGFGVGHATVDPLPTEKTTPLHRWCLQLPNHNDPRRRLVW